MTKFTVSYPGNKQRSTTIKFKEPSIVDGYWSYDKDGTQLYTQQIINSKGEEEKKKIPLGNTMYFVIKTKDIRKGDKINLKLKEYDYIWGFGEDNFDFLNPDDENFPDKPIHIKTEVNTDNGLATISLKLDERWYQVIDDDLGNSIELYFEVSYTNKSGHKVEEILPKKTEDYLIVAPDDRTLFIKTPAPEHNLPEFISYDGDPMLLVKFSTSFIKGEAKNKGLEIAEKVAKKKIEKIAFAKLKKGFMVDNQGKVYTGKRLIYKYKEVYSNQGEYFESIERGKDFGYKHKDQSLHTTKGISQYDYFSKSGKRVTLLGMIDKIGSVFDIFNLVKSAGEELDTSKPIPLDFGPFSPIADLAGVLVQEQKAEMDEILEESIQDELDLAKLEGLEATRKVVNTWNHNEAYSWHLLSISKETAGKLLQGEFRTFEQLDSHRFQSLIEDDKIQLLYREIFSEKKNEYIYLIETIFFDE